MALEGDTFKRLLDRLTDMEARGGVMDYVQADNSFLGILFSTDFVGRRACSCAVISYVP